MKYAALLRGVNVGGNNKLPMKALADMFTNAGCRNVATYIQSGNAVFEAPAQLAPKLSSIVCGNIQSDLGFETCVILRSLPDMERIAAANPYADVDRSHVVFLASQPTAQQTAHLDPNRSPPDRFQVIGGEIYLHTPNGMGNTKLTNAYFDSKLKTIGTARNWRTVLALLAMMQR